MGDAIEPVHAEDLDMPEAEVRRLCPWATEYTDDAGRPYWLRHELDGRSDGQGGPS
jgi:hypothetical protein